MVETRSGWWIPGQDGGYQVRMMRPGQDDGDQARMMETRSGWWRSGQEVRTNKLCNILFVKFTESMGTK